MNKARTALYILAGAILLTACTQSYGTQGAGSPTSGIMQSTTLPAEATMNAIRSSFLTQTAAQAHSSGDNPVPTNTPEFATVASTPASGTTEEATDGPGLVTPTLAGTTATLPAVFTATPGLPATYTLNDGEFPACIARRFNVDLGELLSFNGLAEDDLVFPGDILKIPNTGKVFGGDRARHPHTPNMAYTVKAGDTIYTIACYFGDVDPNAIIQANNLTSPYTLTLGSTIRIP